MKQENRIKWKVTAFPRKWLIDGVERSAIGVVEFAFRYGDEALRPVEFDEDAVAIGVVFDDAAADTPKEI